MPILKYDYCPGCNTPVLLTKVGFKGVYITRTCFPDVRNVELNGPGHMTKIAALPKYVKVKNVTLKRSNFSNRAIGIINFEKPFLNFIVDTMN